LLCLTNLLTRILFRVVVVMLLLTCAAASPPPLAVGAAG
jgi:hypothetical protein